MRVNRAAIVLLAAFAAVVALAVGVRGWLDARAEQQAAEDAERQEQVEAELAAGASGADVEDAQRAAGLSEKEAALASSYTGERAELAAFLSANRWVDPASDAQAAFYPGALLESAPGQGTKAHKFVIRALSKETDGSGAEQVTRWTCSADTSDGDEIFYVVRTGSEGKSWRLELPFLGYSRSFERFERANSVQLDELDSGLVALIGGEEGLSRFEGELEDYCSRVYPTAAHAEWDQTSEIDYVARTVNFELKLDNESGSTVPVSIPIGGGEMKLGGQQ